MTPKEIADRLVEMGIGDKDRNGYLIQHPVHKHWSTHITAENFIQDWRVAGKCLEDLRKRGYSWLLASMPDGKALMTVTSVMPNRESWDAQVVDDNDCRAICEAFCEVNDE